MAVLAERGHRTHDRLEIIEHDRRQQRPHGARGRVDLAPAIPGGELRMRHELVDGVHPRVRNLRRIEPLHDLCGRERLEHGLDFLRERPSILHTQRIGSKSLVVSERGLREHVGAEARPFARVLETEVHLLAVASGERSVRRD